MMMMMTTLVTMMAMMMMIDTDMLVVMMMMMMMQVGPGDDYELSVGGFNDALSTLGDSMAFHNGMKFSAK